MADKYQGTADDRRYKGENMDVTFNLRRCIHSAECLRRASEVFDVERRPWIMIENGTADDIAEVIEHCPSGALHYERKDGGPAEAPAETNVIRVKPNGPLQLMGNFDIKGNTVDVDGETRATLCRCGHSENKPFCDNAHRKARFVAREVEPTDDQSEQTTEGAVTVNVAENGPFRLQGEVIVQNVQRKTLFAGDNTALCRCGESERKPFCDGTHRNIDFLAE